MQRRNRLHRRGVVAVTDVTEKAQVDQEKRGVERWVSSCGVDVAGYVPRVFASATPPNEHHTSRFLGEEDARSKR